MPLKTVDTAIKTVVGPIINDTDFKTREESVAYNESGMEIDVILEKADGTITTTAVTPTTGGDYDWAHLDQGYYELEIPASGGASFNNDAQGILRVVGICDGVLPFSSVAYDIVSATRGTAGTALPNASADAAGGLPISDAGGLDLDTKLANTNEITVARMGALTDWIDGGRLDLLIDAIKTVTDKFQFTGNDVIATLDSEEVTTDSASRTASQADVSSLATAAKLLKYIQLIARSDANITTDNATELAEINADGGSGAGDYANISDSQEAIRDRGDSSWSGGGGGAGGGLSWDGV